MISLVLLGIVLIALVVDSIERRLDRRDLSRSSGWKAPGL